MSFWISLDTNCQTRNICMDCLEREKETEEVGITGCDQNTSRSNTGEEKKTKEDEQTICLFVYSQKN